MRDRLHTPDDNEVFRLPKLIKLIDPKAGDATRMKRRTKLPNAISYYKSRDKASHEHLYSEILLYHAFKNEMEDLKEAREDANACEEIFL